MSALAGEWGQPWLDALAHTLLAFLWQGTAVALVLAALLALTPRRAARVRYAWACLALAGMAALPVATLLSALDTPAVAELARNAAARPETGAAGEAASAPASGPAGLAALASVLALASAPPLPEALHPWVVSGWLAGMLLLCARTLRERSRLEGLLAAGDEAPQAWRESMERVAARLGLARPLRMLQTAEVDVPMVVGVLRPVLLVPASALTGLAPAQLEAVLAHELAHVLRHDPLVNLLQAVVETALFYHPAVWWVSRRIREEREHCADDVAVRCCGDVLLYARALTRLEELRAPAFEAALAVNGGSLLARVRRLLALPASAPRRPWRLLGAALAWALLLATRPPGAPLTQGLPAVAGLEEALADWAARVPPPAAWLEEQLLPAPRAPRAVVRRTVSGAQAPEDGDPAGGEEDEGAEAWLDAAEAEPLTGEADPLAGARSDAAPLTPAGARRGGVLPGGVHLFSEEMTRPVLLASADGVWPFDLSDPRSYVRRDAQSGSMVARCIISAEGRVRDCEMLKGVGALRKGALRALEARRYAPATLDGTPVSVRYVLNIDFRVCVRHHAAPWDAYFDLCPPRRAPVGGAPTMYLTPTRERATFHGLS